VLPTDCAIGLPVLPLGVPGSAVSPGNNNCNLLALPAVKVTSTVLVINLLSPVAE
jgi:hypothetical protein